MPLSGEPHAAILDPQRLAALDLSGLLDSPPEQAFDRFTALAQQILGVPVAMLSLVDKDRQFFKSQVGLPEPWATARETPLSHSFCQQVVINNAPLIVEDAPHDPRVEGNLAISDIGVMAYAGVPVRTSDNQIIGSFCVIDTQPHVWETREIEVLTTLAEMLMREFTLRELTQRLDAQYKALQVTEEQRDNLVHMVIHDLRTPLTSLLVGLQTLDAVTELEAQDQQLLDIAKRGAKSLSEMVNTILDVSRAEAGVLTLECKPVAAAAVIADAMTQVKYLSDQKSLRLTCDVDSELPVFSADEDKLLRVLVNLLGNAIKYTPTTGQIQISVCSHEEDSALLWCVADDGLGIPDDKLEIIFEKFRQVEGPHQNQATSGVGLSFCKLVVEAHGGKIWAESQPGQGSQFYFTLPRA